MRDCLKDPKINERRNPEDHVKDERSEKFRQHHLPVADRCGHERLDCAELKFLREKSHPDERKDQNKNETEEDRVEECLLDRIRKRPLVHVGELEVEIRSRDEEEKKEDDVSDRRVEVTAHFAGDERVK